MPRLKGLHNAASPVELIGASNFFELAVAVVIKRFGPYTVAAQSAAMGVPVAVPFVIRLPSSQQSGGGHQ
jgi:ACR3 family arsenite efflux pump ArsB